MDTDPRTVAGCSDNQRQPFTYSLLTCAHGRDCPVLKLQGFKIGLLTPLERRVYLHCKIIASNQYRAMTKQVQAYEKSVTFRMEPEDYREIERIAQESGVSVAWVL